MASAVTSVVGPRRVLDGCLGGKLWVWIGRRTVGLVVGGLADVLPQTGLLALDDEFGEGVVGAGRAGDSEKGGEDGALHGWLL